MLSDAERLARDRVMRRIDGGCAFDGQAASAPQMGRFETDLLACSDTRAALADPSGQWIDAVDDREGLNSITLDVDRSLSPARSAREGTAWSGHFGCNCDHPLFILNPFGQVVLRFLFERAPAGSFGVRRFSANGWGRGG